MFTPAAARLCRFPVRDDGYILPSFFGRTFFFSHWLHARHATLKSSNHIICTILNFVGACVRAHKPVDDVHGDQGGHVQALVPLQAPGAEVCVKERGREKYNAVKQRDEMECRIIS